MTKRRFDVITTRRAFDERERIVEQCIVNLEVKYCEKAERQVCQHAGKLVEEGFDAHIAYMAAYTAACQEGRAC